MGNNENIVTNEAENQIETEAKMTCPNCGAEITKETKFCKNCGKNLSETGSQEAPAFTPSDSANVNASNKKEKKPKNIIQKILIGIGIAFGVLMVITIGTMLIGVLGAPNYDEEIIGTWTGYEDARHVAEMMIENDFADSKEILGFVDMDDVDFTVKVRYEFSEDGKYITVMDMDSAVDWYQKIYDIELKAIEAYVTNAIEQYGIDSTVEEAMDEIGITEWKDLKLNAEDLELSEADLQSTELNYKVLDDWLVFSNDEINASLKSDLDLSKSRYIVIEIDGDTMTYKEAVNYDKKLMDEDELTLSTYVDFASNLPMELTRESN